MKLNKKLISIGSLALVALPIAIAASCSSPMKRTVIKKTSDSQASESPTSNIGPEHKLSIDPTHDLIWY
ncbi:Vmc-like lipoprotein signal peptide domain-containing protein [Mycoplasma todarodis]|uniref:Vmc-like lipoprotein signal peptide domain-containing protein n=1 Tax=Mycoplasma todarodis TaxID=1937191 RepID=UPI003B2C2EE3